MNIAHSCFVEFHFTFDLLLLSFDFFYHKGYDARHIGCNKKATYISRIFTFQTWRANILYQHYDLKSRAEYLSAIIRYLCNQLPVGIRLKLRYEIELLI